MLHIVAVEKDMKLKENISLQELREENVKWFWVDFDCPSVEESTLLESFFNFHPLAIEDCLHNLQRPKIDFYDNYSFLVVHALQKETLTPSELDIFVGENFIVSYHLAPLKEVENSRVKILSQHQHWKEGSVYVQYELMDNLVDNYFPIIYQIEDYLNQFDEIDVFNKDKNFVHKLFEIRNRLLKLRRIINQMKDLLYRIVNSENMRVHKSRHVYFADVYDHLLRLSEFIESSILVTSDLRESYISINSDRMNRIMMLFTAITTIFVPLTFIVGIYGMNFDNIPELHFRYGYFITLGVMGMLAVFMLFWFRKKGWFKF